MTPTFTPRPGLIGLVHVHGAVGLGIRVGQFLNKDGFEDYEHAFVTLPGGLILEAEPGGAVIRPLHYDRVYWCNGLYRLLPPHTTDTEFSHVGEALKGIGYSFLDYDALFVHRLHIPVPGLQEYIQNTGHLICSQLADEYYLRLGAHVFSDNRWPGYVTPGMLYKRDKELLAA